MDLKERLKFLQTQMVKINEDKEVNKSLKSFQLILKLFNKRKLSFSPTRPEGQ